MKPSDFLLILSLAIAFSVGVGHLMFSEAEAKPRTQIHYFDTQNSDRVKFNMAHCRKLTIERFKAGTIEESQVKQHYTNCLHFFGAWI